MKTLTALSLALLLAACGGGGGSSPATAPAKPIGLDVESDSTGYGTQVINGVPSRTANNPPSLLQKAFGNVVSVTNSAVGGATVTQALNGIAPRYAAPLASRLASLAPQLVLSNFGINDSQGDPAAYRSSLTTWVSTVRAMGAVPVLEEPNPVCDAAHPQLDAFVAILRDVAQQQGVTLIAQYDYIRSLPGWQSMLTDCVHPGDPMYAIKANREYATLLPIVEGLQR